MLSTGNPETGRNENRIAYTKSHRNAGGFLNQDTCYLPLTFKEIKYEKNGTYYYELKEETNNKDAEANITYDSNVYLIKVQVENGKPEMSYCKFDKDKVDISKVTSDGVTWTTCTDNPTFSFYNSSDITVQKNFINGTWDNNTSFKFSLKAVNGLVNNSADRLVWDRSINNNTPIPEKSEVNTDDKTASITIGSKNVNDSGNYVNSFKGIKYAKDGTYYYELEEEKPKDADTNINYDSNIYLIKVHVEDGKSEITYYKVDKEADSTVTKKTIILNNNEWKTYQANSTFEFTNTPKGSAILQVSKNLVDEQGVSD
jgi:pilin isopeptide linkage protein